MFTKEKKLGLLFLGKICQLINNIRSMLEWLQNWYKSQCNNDWEHIFGIKIETIDNPGWEITIDLEGTEFILNDIPWTLIGDFENTWIGYKIENHKFNGASDPNNLCTTIFAFKELIEKGYISEDEIYGML